MFQIYYINIARRTDRNDHMKKMLKIFDKYDIKYERIDAIDGKTLNFDDLIEKKIISQNFDKEKPTMRKGEIGCTLSHFKAWNKFMESSAKYGIFFEDDINVNEKYFNDIFSSVLQEIQKLTFDWCYLGLNTLNDLDEYDINIPHNEINKYFYRVTSYHYGAHAYILTKECVKKLQNYYKNGMYHPFDFMFRYAYDIPRLFNEPFECISIKPDVIYYNTYDKNTFKYKCGSEYLFYAKDWTDSDTSKIEK